MNFISIEITGQNKCIINTIEYTFTEALGNNFGFEYTQLPNTFGGVNIRFLNLIGYPISTTSGAYSINSPQCFKIINTHTDNINLYALSTTITTPPSHPLSTTYTGPYILNTGATIYYYYNPSNKENEMFTMNPCCLHGSSLIETIYGLKKIENIQAGDRVKDLNGKFINVVYNIKYIPTSKYVCIKKNSIGNNIPFMNLYGTCGHPLLIKGKELTFADLVNDNTITNVTIDEDPVYSLCTEERTYVLTNGLPVCTWSQNEWINSRESKTQYWVKL